MELGFNGTQATELSRHGNSHYIEELQQCCSDIELDRECLSGALHTMDQLDAVLSWIRKGEGGQHPSNQAICEALSSVLVVGKNTRASAHAFPKDVPPEKVAAAVEAEEQNNARKEVQMMQQRVMGLQEELSAAKSEANVARSALAVALEAALQSVNRYGEAEDTLESSLGQWEMQVRDLKSELDGKKKEVKDIKARMIMALKALAAHPGRSSPSLPATASELGPHQGDNATVKETDDSQVDAQGNHSLNMVSWLADSDTLAIVEVQTAKYLPGSKAEPSTESPHQTWTIDDHLMKRDTQSPPTTPYSSPAGLNQARTPAGEKTPRGYKPPVGMTYIEMLEELAAPFSHLQTELEVDSVPGNKLVSKRVEEQDSVDTAQEQSQMERAHEEQHLLPDDGLSDSLQLETTAAPVGDANEDENDTPQAMEMEEAAATQQSGDEVTQQGQASVDSTPQEITGSTLEDMVQEYLRKQKNERAAGSSTKHGLGDVPISSKDDKRKVEEEPHHWQPSPRKQWVPSVEMLRIAAPKPGRTYTEQYTARAEAQVTLKHLLSPQRVYDNNKDSRKNLRMKKISKIRQPDSSKGRSREARAQGSGRSSPSMSAGLLYPAMQWHQAVASAEQAGHPSPGGAALSIAKDWGVTMANETKLPRASAAQRKDSFRRSLSAPDLEFLASSVEVPPSQSPGITQQAFNAHAKLGGTDSTLRDRKWGGFQAEFQREGEELPDSMDISTRLFHDEGLDSSSMDGQEDQPDAVGVFEIKVFCNPDSSNAASISTLRVFLSRWKQACGWSSPAAMVLNEVSQARKAIQAMARSELAALRVYTHPPPAVRSTLEALAIILSQGHIPRSWGQVLTIVRSEGLKALLLAFSPALLPQDAACLLQAHYLSMPSFVVSEVAHANHALGPLLLWIKAMVTFSLFRGCRTAAAPPLASASKAGMGQHAAFPRQPGGFIKAPPTSPSGSRQWGRKSISRAWEEKLGLWRSELAASIIMSAQAELEAAPSEGPAAHAEAAAMIASSKGSPVAGPDLTRVIMRSDK